MSTVELIGKTTLEKLARLHWCPDTGHHPIVCVNANMYKCTLNFNGLLCVTRLAFKRTIDLVRAFRTGRVLDTRKCLGLV